MTTRDALRPAAAWLVVAVVLERVQDVTHGHLALHRPLRATEAWRAPFGPPFGRVAWDSGLYLTVARYGYRLGDGLEAGFPGYAMAIRGLVALTGIDWLTAGVAISAACGLVAAILGWRWLAVVGLEGPDRWVALLVVLLFPSSFMLYGVAYNESLVLAAVLGAFVAAERGRWTLAGCCGAVATYTRPTAIVVPAFLVLFLLLRTGALAVEPPATAGLGGRLRSVRWRPRRIPAAGLGVLLSFAGIGAYLLWLWGHAGDPLYTLRLQSNTYGHTPIWHPYAWLKFPVWKDVVHSPADVAHEVGSFVLLIGAVASVPSVVRRLGGAYGALVLGFVACSWSGTYDFAPAGRYLLPALPVLAAVWGPWLARRAALAVAVLLASAALMVALAVGFAGAFSLNW